MQSLADDTERLLEELHDGMRRTLFSGLFDETTKAVKATPFDTAASLREPIFYGGESAYSFQYLKFSLKKYSEDDLWLLANKGFRISDAGTVVESLARAQDTKLQATVTAMASQSPETWTFLPGFTFTAAEIAASASMKIETVQSVLAAFVHPPENLNGGFVTLNDYNAVSGSPILVRSKDEYILFQQYGLFEALYEAPFYWLCADSAYAPTALANRGKFTEALAVERLKRVFGTYVYPNVDVWKKKGEKLGEIDALVLFGDRAIVFQAKSKRMTLEARKGNDQQMKSDFKRAVQEAYDQALLCTTALLGPTPILTDADGNELKIQSPMKVAYPVCVVADHYPALASQARAFLQFAKTENVAAPLVTDVFALDTMTEMLETPLHLLSYIDRRARFGSKVIATHEHTILAYHLRHNLWIGDDFDGIALDDKVAAELDVAMTVRRAGLPGQRTPSGILTRSEKTPVARILTQIEAQADPVTIGLGLLLLRMSGQSVDFLNRGIRLASSAALKDKQLHDITLEFKTTSCGLTVHVSPEPKAQATVKLRDHCAVRKYSAKAETWYGLVLRPENESIRFGLKLEFSWTPDNQMYAAVRAMPPRNEKPSLSLIRARKPGRNDPCTCGSGRKYKKCCMS